MKIKHTALSKITASVLILFLLMSLFGCEDQNSVDNQDFIDQDVVNKEETNKQETVDYSQMSKEEIITAFLKAWEKDDMKVMNELSDFPEYFLVEKKFDDFGYHGLFCWAGLSFVQGEVTTCEHGCDEFSHAVYDIKIRQCDNTDYGCAPEEDWQNKYPNYENTYSVTFLIDENSIIRHLDVCAFGGEEGKSITDQSFEQNGVYVCSQYFNMRFDEENGHWVIVDKKYTP